MQFEALNRCVNVYFMAKSPLVAMPPAVVVVVVVVESDYNN